MSNNSELLLNNPDESGINTPPVAKSDEVDSVEVLSSLFNSQSIQPENIITLLHLLTKQH